MSTVSSRRRAGIRGICIFASAACLALTGAAAALAQESPAVATARSWVAANLASLGLEAADVAGMTLSSESRSRSSGVAHVYFQQRHQELAVHRAILAVHVGPAGEVVGSANRFVAGLAARADAVAPDIDAVEAVGAGAAHLRLALTEPLVPLATPGGPERRVVLSGGGISRSPIEAHLVYQPLANGRVALAWNLEIETLDTLHVWSVRVDAREGEILDLADRVVSDRFDGGAKVDGGGRTLPAPRTAAGAAPAGAGSAQYEVFALPSEYPADGPRVVVVDPHDPTASPFGWHDTDGAAGPEFTITRGNNVDAYADRNGDNTADPGSQPDGGAGLDFTGVLVAYDETEQPDQYIEAAVVNLFYWNNILHDVLHRYGFDELAGNFQVNNYGNGGAGNDTVRAEAQDNADGGSRNNANFATPVDGSPPRMQMYLWDEPTPERDGDFSSMIVAHEYGHGLSKRLVGGPGDVDCLDNGEQMGEGWSDFVGLVLTAKASDLPTTWRGVGTWAQGQDPDTGAGIRPAVYTTDLAVNGFTYADLPSLAVPHGVGFAFATMLWDLYWLLVEDHGFNPDVYGDWTTGGNNLALQLVVDGMKLVPCSPGFADARNAILQADVNLTGGANECRIWEAFARRGLGWSAAQGSTDDPDDGIAAFDLPPACDLVAVVAPPLGAAICAGEDALFSIEVGAGFTNGPVTLAAAGEPAGTSVAFSPNPVSPVPGASTMTVSGTAAAAPGSYPIDVTGSDGLVVGGDVAALEIFDAPPGAPALLLPVDGAVDVARAPVLSWSRAAGVDAVLVEVDDDPAFGSIDRSASVPPPFSSWRVDPPLEQETFYYWRTRAENACGAGADSETRSFLTEVALCSAPGVAIPDDDPAGVEDSLAVALLGSVADLDVQVRAMHSYVGELRFELRHEESGTTIVLVDQAVAAGGFTCAGDDVDVVFDDQGPGDAATSCDGGAPALDGHLRPQEALAGFVGESLAGTWTLRASDVGALADGTLDEWCLLPRGAGAGSALVATKEVAGLFTPGSGVRYTVTIENVGAVDQPDNPGDELFDALPPELLVFDATASSGIVSFDPGTNSVSWNGAIAAGGSLVVTFDALILDDTPVGTLVVNQGVLSFDTNGNGTNESSAPTDDPALPAADDPTEFVVRAPVTIQEIPTLGSAGAAVLALLLVGLALAALRRRAAG